MTKAWIDQYPVPAEPVTRGFCAARLVLFIVEIQTAPSLPGHKHHLTVVPLRVLALQVKLYGKLRSMF